jgi:hypothetical protein
MITRWWRPTIYLTSFLFQADGKLGACGWDYNLNISDGPLLDIWRSHQRTVLQDAFRAWEDNLPDTCKSCTMIYEWSPIPSDLVRYDEEIIESRGPTSFMGLFRGFGNGASDANVEAAVTAESIFRMIADSRSASMFQRAKDTVGSLARSLRRLAWQPLNKASKRKLVFESRKVAFRRCIELKQHDFKI